MKTAPFPKVIFFDAAGTLLHLPRGVASHYREVAQRHGWVIDEAVFGRAFYSAWRAAPPPPTTREPRPDDDRGWWRALVEQILDACGVPPGQGRRDPFFAELYREFTLPGVWELYAEAREVLDALAPRCALGIISNFDGRLRVVLDHLGLLHRFHPIVISSEVGADKPDPWIFQSALRAARIAPHDALHVGDDAICDWEGAEAAGLRSFRLDRPKNSLRDLLAALDV